MCVGGLGMQTGSLGMQAGGFCHYIDMPLSDEMFKTVAVFQACYCISNYLCECRCTVVTDILISSLRLTNTLTLLHPILGVALIG